jgi:SAM-dependent methyltransferase
MAEYVHGYSQREFERLNDQAGTLKELLHYDTHYGEGDLVLEAGCGVGAQTQPLAEKSPKAKIVSLDVSLESVKKATERIVSGSIKNVNFLQADISRLPFRNEIFDHLFVCFLLEHLEVPDAALIALKKHLKKGGTVTVIEGDHGSCYFHPETDDAKLVWNCLIKVQALLKADSLIGRRLYPLLNEAGFGDVSVSPRFVYSDESRPRMVDGFVRKTIIPMVETARERALKLGLVDGATWKKGIADLHKTAAPGGTFCYTFFKAVGRK